uniref:Uncharacterized protein n=1 Tax=Candidatus Kentrum sp. LFY TaxID=2126342 RepID=A0A450WTL5_9GAMM|nr:MAG: hypothetical protein BECKLFY1418C_GA0070996_107115 [Candidatus Kentron sp. LFY]
MAALFHAKQALIGWAVSHPSAPGSMPWPDRNADGNYDGDSDCASLSGDAVFNPSFLLGRLPWRGRTNPCERTHGGLGVDVRDGASERLWYAVSRNLIRRYQSPAGYPRIDVELADNAPFPWFTVRDGEGGSISDRVAVVLVAPGEASGEQDRSGGAPGAENYLDIHAGTGIGNGDSDGCFDNRAGCGGSDGEEFVLADADSVFNDRLVFITVDELMMKVERRVLNEVDQALDNYRETSGVYPWMSPFAYPATMVSGRVTENAEDAARTLIDGNADFIAAGVRRGQVVRNVGDGSKGIIESVDSRSLSLTSEGLRHGEDNRFDINRIGDPDDNDRYEILVDTSGMATNGSLGNTLRDASRSVGFDALGIGVGDMVENVGDETYGVVAGMPDSVTLTLRRLASDETMAFDLGDSYEIPRFNGIPNTREGALPLHAVGERFRTGFTVAWKIPDGVMETTRSVNNVGYLESLQGTLRCSGMEGEMGNRMMAHGENGNCRVDRPSVTVPWANGSCSWQTSDSVRCQGRTDWRWYLAGTVTGNHGLGPMGFEDSDTDFREMGVSAGDVALNVTDGSRGVIRLVTDHGVATFQSYGGTRNDFRIGDRYRIRVATKIIPEKNADCADIAHGGGTITCDARTLVDTGAHFRENGVRAGDTIGNQSKGWWGIVREVGRPGAFANAEGVLWLESMGDPGGDSGGNGSAGGFAHGDRYVIRSGFVDKRRYIFDVAFMGDGVIRDNAGLRSVETRLGMPLGKNLIGVQDRDAVNRRTVADAVIRTKSATATETTAIGVSGIQLDLAPDFPAWFFDNHWYKFIYMAASSAHLPGGNGDCRLGNDCLRLKTVGPGGIGVRADIEALVISAGRATNGADCLQIRPASNPNRYFEKENVHSLDDSDSTFERRRQGFLDDCFRDRIKVVMP